MTFTQNLIVLLGLYLCAYSLFDRLCKCIETCTMAKSFAEFYGLNETGDKHELSENNADQHC